MAEMRLRRRHASLAALLGVAASIVFSGVGVAAAATIEGTNSISAWSPNTASVTTAESVIFKNSSASVPHGVGWTGGPVTPSCPGVVGSPGQTSWEGTCTFSQAGSYPFMCTVHGSMTGTVTVTSSGPGPPVVSTGTGTPTSDTEATLNGSVNPSGQATTYHFKYGTTTSYGQTTTVTSAGEGNAAVAKSAMVSGLTAATTYHFQIVATNASGTVNGADKTFTTTGPPSATTEQPTTVGGKEATLPGIVNPRGHETTYFFKYGTTEAYGQETSKKPAGQGTTNVSVSAALTGLTPETTYHFRLVAENSSGTTMGIDRTFKTFGAPLATTGQAAGVSDTGATLEGLVNPRSQDTTYYFNYGTTASYGQKTAEKAAGKGTSNVSASASLTGLSPETTYHFQLVAKNGSGTTLGDDQTFTTGSIPPPPPPPPPPSPPPPPPPLLPPPPLGAAPPDTKITLKPPAKTRDRTPTVKFAATIGGASYQCSVDGKAFKTCRSPFTAPSLKPGRHRIRVKAVANGLADLTPASCSFTVVAKKR